MTRKTSLSLTLALPLAALALSGALAATAGAQTAPAPAPAAASPISGDADSSGATSALESESGHDIYMRICAACHMPDARGAVGAGFYPALAENPRLRASRYPAYVVINGLNGMPSMADMLTDEQAADVINYVRTSFGNDFPSPVTPAEIAALR